MKIIKNRKLLKAIKYKLFVLFYNTLEDTKEAKETIS